MKNDETLTGKQLADTDIIGRIRYFQQMRGYTNAQLNKKCGLKYGTISGLYHRESYPQLKTLYKILDGLEITLSQFVNAGSEGLVKLSEEDREFVAVFHSLPPDTRNDFMRILKVVGPAYSKSLLQDNND